MADTEHEEHFVIATGQTSKVSDFLDAAFSILDLEWQDHVQIDSRCFRPAEVDALQGDSSKANRSSAGNPRGPSRNWRR